jgi:hypothetical protein
MLLMSVNIFFE